MSEILKRDDISIFMNKCDDLERLIGTDILKKEARLILEIIKNDNMTIKQAMISTGVSYRGFYMMIEKLLERDLIIIYPDLVDKRVKRIRLNQTYQIAA
jgi:DNA-binding MarR family transcriptional regulator